MAAVRHGSRWLHEQPTEDEVKAWFDSQHLHPGMDHEPYYGGIVVIGATEKVKVTKTKANGDTFVAEIEQAVFTPYVKVDTRIAYFRDYVRLLNGGQERGDFVGVIEPVEQKHIGDPNSAFFNANLPEGFAIYAVRNPNDSVNRYLVATYRVAIYERQSYGERVAGKPAVPILQGTGSKQTAQARNWADDYAIMKAETGAIGRALGVAGILVVGTGVATAEDIQEAAAGPAGAAGAAGAGAVLPEVVGAAEGAQEAPVPADQPEAEQTRVLDPQAADEELREHALKLQAEMERGYPASWGAYREWWQGRGFGPISELTGPALRGAVVKLQRDLDEAKRQATDPGSDMT